MSRLYVPFLLAGMILTGSSNSLWSKWQDMQCVENCTNPDPATHVVYEQPVWQTLQMFIGEMLCFLPVIYTALVAPRPPVQLDTDDASKSQPLRGARILLLWIPAACDLTGTTLMNVGLLYTPVSIYQMTRGSVVLFVGTFSVLFLRRRLWLYQWVSLIIVMSGVALVGYSGSLAKHAISQQAIGALARISGTEEQEVTKVLVGVFLTIFAQVFTATQFVVEEKIMSRYSVSPLVAVGFEGLFGTLSVLLFVPFLAIPAVTRISPFFDLPRGWTQMINTPTVLFSGIAICLSISLFNFFGLSVTRHVSATARSLADTCRTLSIWLISLGLGWEHFVWPISLVQVLGFALLVYGTFLFNDLVAPLPCLPGPPTAAEVDEGEESERTGLLSGSIEAGAHSQTLDETAVLPSDLGRGGYDVLPQGEHIRGYEVADEQGSSIKP